jgi:hypothetical protein
MLIKEDTAKGFKSAIFKIQQRIKRKSKKMIQRQEQLNKELPANRIQLNNLNSEINAINSFYDSKGKPYESI